jgi:hypothetical protein
MYRINFAVIAAVALLSIHAHAFDPSSGPGPGSNQDNFEIGFDLITSPGDEAILADGWYEPHARVPKGSWLRMHVIASAKFDGPNTIDFIFAQPLRLNLKIKGKDVVKEYHHIKINFPDASGGLTLLNAMQERRLPHVLIENPVAPSPYATIDQVVDLVGGRDLLERNLQDDLKELIEATKRDILPRAYVFTGQVWIDNPLSTQDYRAFPLSDFESGEVTGEVASVRLSQLTEFKPDLLQFNTRSSKLFTGEGLKQLLSLESVWPDKKLSEFLSVQEKLIRRMIGLIFAVVDRDGVRQVTMEVDPLALPEGECERALASPNGAPKGNRLLRFFENIFRAARGP